MTQAAEIGLVTYEIDTQRLLAARDAIQQSIVAGHEDITLAIKKANVEVRRFMTIELNAKYQFIFNVIYAPVAEQTIFPDDQGSFHPYYTPAYMRLCGVIGSLLLNLPIRVGIPWMHYRLGNPAIHPNIYGPDRVSAIFYSTEERIHFQLASPGVRWAVFPPGIGKRFILAKSMFVTQTPGRPFLIITNTSHQMEWVRVLATVNDWTVENGSLFLFGNQPSQPPVLAPGSELKAIVVNCHDFWHVGQKICNGALLIGLTIIDGSAVIDEAWFRPPMLMDTLGQIYPSPILALSPQLRTPTMNMFDCGPIARMIVNAVHSTVELPMIEFMQQIHSIDQFNGFTSFTSQFEDEIRTWIQSRRFPPKQLIQSSLAFRVTSEHFSCRYSHRMIGTPLWNSDIHVSRAAKRIAQIMCFIPEAANITTTTAATTSESENVSVSGSSMSGSNKRRRNGKKRQTATAEAVFKYGHSTFNDMFMHPVFVETFRQSCVPLCTSRNIEAWECSVCYGSFSDCTKPWDALVTQCCSTEVCVRCYFKSTSRSRQCIICGPDSCLTMPFVPAICLYNTPQPAAEMVPPIPEIELHPHTPVNRTLFDVDYPRVFYQALRKYLDTNPDAVILMTPTPFGRRVDHFHLAPYLIEFRERTFREFTNTARIIMWDPETTRASTLPRFPTVTDIVIGNFNASKDHVDKLVKLCDHSTVSVRYAIWDTR